MHNPFGHHHTCCLNIDAEWRDICDAVDNSGLCTWAYWIGTARWIEKRLRH
jgi:hypothetical protein